MNANVVRPADSSADKLDVLIVDWHGGLRGKRLPASMRDKILGGEARMPLSTQAMDIWGDDQDSITKLALSQGDPDGVCIPASSGFYPQPWNSSHEQIICSLHTLSGAPSEFDVRAILQKQVNALALEGLHAVVAVELEFYLLDGSTRTTGQPRIPDQLTIAGSPNELQLYDMRTMDRVEEVISRIHSYAQALDIPAETTLAEFGPGQFEINLKHQSNPVLAADHAVLFKQIVDRAAQKSGLVASFMAKPYTEHGGSGQHVHVSLLDDKGANILDTDSRDRQSNLLFAVAGCIEHLKASQLVLAPHGNSYRRLQPENFAPVRCDWGYDHRGVAVRLPETQGAAARLEHRVAGADANSYLVLTIILASILAGLKNARQPAIQALMPGESASAEFLTHDWLTAIDHFEASPWITETLGEHFCTVYSRIKRHEAQTYNRQVSDVDLKTYLSRV
ncbi:MAG: glutamine synthetase family protein [Granulosicoccus sp.]